MENANSPEYLEKIKRSVIENLSRTKFGPSVQMTEVPRDPEGMDDEADAELDDLDEDMNKDVRRTQRSWDKYVENPNELSESEDEETHPANRGPRRRGIMEYRNPLAVPDFDSGAETPANGEVGDSVNGDILEKENGMLDHDDDEKDDAEQQGGQDVEMEDEVNDAEDGAETAVPRTQQPTATDADVEMKDDVDGETEPAVAKEEGMEDRVEEDTNAEAATRAAET